MVSASDQFFELNFSARGVASWSEMHVCLTSYVVRARFNTNPKREAVSRRVKLLRELFHAVSRVVAKSFYLLSGMINARILELISTSNCASTQ